jgi:hypothetical protein
MVTCPRCGITNKYIYQGLIHAECTSASCPNYSEDLNKLFTADQAKYEVQTEEEDADLKEMRSWASYMTRSYKP